MNESNDYLNQVVAEQARVDKELRPRQQVLALPEAAAARGLGKGMPEFRTGATARAELDEEEPSSSGPTVAYRITGWFRWKTVVVPPNVYIVHTRRDHPEPLHVGLGVSFRFNPYTDAFLVIPAAVQTLLINAKCICAERQGVLVQAYVQWIVDDVYTAYRKVDFSDAQDPMRIVNIQLREQAEAAIKDKVATMSIDAILTDKQPIIEELTHRLRTVAEGSREGNAYTGLGLKIVTVQIKEAVVSSTRLWENLQKPFRAERERLARLAELAAQQQIATQEVENQQARATAAMGNERLLAQIRAQADQEAIAQRTKTERANHDAELELAIQQLQIETRRIEEEMAILQKRVELERAKAEVERSRTAATIEIENLKHQAQAARGERDLVLAKVRQEIENSISDASLRARVIGRLPEIAAALPKPDELRAVSVGPDQNGTTSALVGFLASVMQGVEGALKRKDT
jgi:hypothetical protein